MKKNLLYVLNIFQFLNLNTLLTEWKREHREQRLFIIKRQLLETGPC